MKSNVPKFSGVPFKHLQTCHRLLTHSSSLHYGPGSFDSISPLLHGFNLKTQCALLRTSHKTANDGRTTMFVVQRIYSFGSLQAQEFITTESH